MAKRGPKKGSTRCRSRQNGGFVGFIGKIIASVLAKKAVEKVIGKGPYGKGPYLPR